MRAKWYLTKSNFANVNALDILHTLIMRLNQSSSI